MCVRVWIRVCTLRPSVMHPTHPLYIYPILEAEKRNTCTKPNTSHFHYHHPGPGACWQSLPHPFRTFVPLATPLNQTNMNEIECTGPATPSNVHHTPHHHPLKCTPTPPTSTTTISNMHHVPHLPLPPSNMHHAPHLPLPSPPQMCITPLPPPLPQIHCNRCLNSSVCAIEYLAWSPKF